MRTLLSYSFLALTFAAAGGAQIVLDPNPARVLGHPAANPPEELVVTNVNPNFGAGGGLYSPYGVAVDTSGTTVATPILYVADTYNNRILAWKNATSSALTNQQAPDLIIGQPNAATTLAATNGGLYYPTGLLADPQGNLFVVDSGNNRVLRYPRPFANSNSNPDIVLGQPDRYTSNKGNQGGAISAQTLCLDLECPRGYALFLAWMAMDSAGNLFVSDAGNGRVLRFSAGLLTPGAADPAADLVIGQAGFTAVTNPSGVTDRNILNQPAGLAFDSAGNLFVADTYPYNRLVVFPPTVSSPAATNNIAAIRLAGIVNPPPSTVTASTLSSPYGVVMINNGPAVVDTGANRLLIFDPFTSKDWTVTTGDTTYSTPPPVAIAVLGQGSSLTNFTTSSANAGNPQASFSSNGATIATFFYPAAAATGANGDLFVADAGNNRVLVYPTAGKVATASVVLGQSGFPYDAPNSIHGMEFDFGPVSAAYSYDAIGAGSVPYDAGIAVDSSGSTPHLYVSDPSNHRVLGFADARKVGPGVQADIVIGEPDLLTALCNYGGVVNPPAEQLPRQPTASSLCYPTGLAVDPSGNLFIADSSNGRVLRFPAPFEAANSSQQANLVLGQSAFTGISNPQASQSVMVFPYGLVFDPARGLLVSDEAANRVLLFSMTSPTNGETASAVIGQPSFTATGAAVLNAPHHIAEDTIGEVYVADSGHNQILIFDIPATGSNNEPGNSITGLSYPEAIWVNQNTVAGYHNDIWVGDAGYGLSRFPVPNPLVSGSTPTLTTPAAEVAGPSITCPRGLCGYTAVAVTQDSFGALYVADATNRVAIHYPAMQATNAANYGCSMGCLLGPTLVPTVGLAPDAFGALFTFSPYKLPLTVTSNTVLPVPKTLGGVQVLLNGVASPLAYVGPNQINFVVPIEAPTAGTAQLRVVDATTSQVLASGDITMALAAPAFFTKNSSGMGQIAALNCNQAPSPCEDTQNSTSNPIQPGKVIQLYLTGQGLVQGEPSDGQAAPGAVPTGSKPVVYIGGAQGTVQYSGLAPGYVGLWQINVQVPTDVNSGFFQNFPTNVYPVLVEYESLVSNTPANNSNPSVAATIVVNGP
jgi:uncharacterized protein (TIGR03437 family)